MPASNKKKSKNRHVAVVVTLVLIAIVALIGLIGFFALNKPPSAAVPENIVEYPTVSSSISSSKDGKAHTIDVDLIVEYEDGAQDKTAHDAVYEAMNEIVASLDYERLKQKDSVEHIEQVVAERLSGVAGGRIEQVYVGNIAIDYPGVLDSTEVSGQSGSQNKEKLKGLFKNLKD